ncbi:cytochrome c biogenesis protein ResB [Micrococcus luteus]
MARWAWTQITSMRTALMLLLLLAVAAVPGSLVPQRRAGPEIVDQWIEDNPFWGPILDFLQFFDVYTSVWFSAIYLLLFVSLVGCVVPRAIKHVKVMKAPPPRTPRRLSRLPESGTVVLEQDGPAPEQAVAQAKAWLKRRRYRVADCTDERGVSVSAERGYLREIGNIVFHFSLIGVLVFMAYGGMTKYGGQKIIVEGEGFANNLVAYDSFTPGTYFSADDLQPFSLKLESFDAVFERQSNTHYGQPLDYTAVMDVREGSGGELQRQILKVNQPLDIDGVRVYLVGNGYAPVVTIRDGAGDVAFQGPVVTRVFDNNYGSQATIKVPDARPDQLGFVGFFLPSAVEDEEGAAFSADPELLNPELQLNSYYGDLGLDTGRPQNVYVLDTESLTELNSRTNEHGGIVLGQGETYELPEGRGTISFDGVRRYVGLDIHYDPGKWGVGVFAGTALLGLAISLFVRRRRVWVRAEADESGRTRVEYALLARGEATGLRDENVALRTAMEKMWPVTAPENDNGTDEGRAPAPRPIPGSGV